MRGYEEYNFPAFDEAAAKLRSVGYEVVSPAEMDIKVGFDPLGPFTSDDFKRAMARDLPEVALCDGIVLIDGWEKSHGAAIELYVAGELGNTVLTLDEALALPV